MRLDSILEITTAAGRGDEAAFDLFYDMYADRMYRYLIVVTRGDEEFAREVCQESLMRVVRHLKPLATDEDVWRWLARIMRSAFIDTVRKGAHARELERKYAQYLKDIAGPADEEEQESVFLSLLNKALDLLKPDDKELVEQYYFSNCSQAELAEKNGSTPKAVGMKLVRVRKQLREMILKELASGT